MIPYTGDLIDFFEIELAIIYFLVIYIVATGIKKRNIKKVGLYKYFIPGLIVRVFGGLMVCMIYLFYYEGGDTINYYLGSLCMINLMLENFPAYLKIMAGDVSFENYFYFNNATGYPPLYMYRDVKTFSVVCIANPLVFLCGRSFLTTTIVLSALAYSGPWRLFLIFCREFPGLAKQLAIAILFIPSVFFWGSGLLKDTFTFSAICWYTFSFYKIFIVKEDRLVNALFILVSIWVLIAIKPYLFIAVFPGSILWYIFHKVNQVKGSVLRFLYFPFATVVGLIIAFGLTSILGSQLGKYKLDRLLDVAIITQDDLSRESYGPNSFDIGEIDGSTMGLISKAPVAITATLFRPFIWEINNPWMLLSALENSVILILVILLFLRIKPLAILRIITEQPIIMFSLIFSIILAYSIGLSTANFGALVRYKIPIIPFFLSSILIIQHYYKLGDRRLIEKEMQAD